MRRPGSGLLHALLVWTALLVGGCSDPEDPAARVRAFVSDVADSAQRRRWRDFREYVADDYRDGRGLDKDAALAVVTRYILANQRIHVLTRVAEIRVDGANGGASAIVYAAMAGQPMATAGDLARVTADVYRFEIRLDEGADGALQVVRGDWQAVPIADFLLGD